MYHFYAFMESLELFWWHKVLSLDTWQHPSNNWWILLSHIICLCFWFVEGLVLICNAVFMSFSKLPFWASKLEFSNPPIRGLNIQYVISAAWGLSIKTKPKMFASVVKGKPLLSRSDLDSSWEESWVQSQTFWRNKHSEPYQIYRQMESSEIPFYFWD